MKLKIREAVAVEGRYDAHAVRAAVDTLVIELGGFSALRSAEKRRLLETVAAGRGLILLTDSDAAGFLIRGRLRGQLRGAAVKMAYVPAVKGKERRKSRRSAEGLLGVEGMSAEVIRAALLDAGATPLDGGAESRKEAAGGGAGLPVSAEAGGAEPQEAADRKSAPPPAQAEGGFRERGSFLPETDGASPCAAAADGSRSFPAADKPSDSPPVTRAELYERGFFGRADSARKRAALLAALDLPANLSVNALTELLDLPAYRRKYQTFLEQTEVESQ